MFLHCMGQILCIGGYSGVMFTREFLSRLRGRALRKGLWYRALDHVERGIFCLTCRLVDRVESEVLGVVLVGIVDKLRKVLKSEFVRLMEIYGARKARIIVKQAMNWGNKRAFDWVHDLDFIRYLTNITINYSS